MTVHDKWFTLHPMDVLSRKQRSYCMSRIKGRNTKTEIMFRKLLWANGIRGYRLHAKLPGRPDLYFPRKKVAVFVDGCFWHKCPKCFVRPKSNRKFWDSKIAKNVYRDRRNTNELKASGIRVLRFWQHQIASLEQKNFRKIVDLFGKL